MGGRPGSKGHWTQDADVFAEWGVDWVKMSWCNSALPRSRTRLTTPCAKRCTNRAGTCTSACANGARTSRGNGVMVAPNPNGCPGTTHRLELDEAPDCRQCPDPRGVQWEALWLERHEYGKSRFACAYIIYVFQYVESKVAMNTTHMLSSSLWHAWYQICSAGDRQLRAGCSRQRQGGNDDGS